MPYTGMPPRMVPQLLWPTPAVGQCCTRLTFAIAAYTGFRLVNGSTECTGQVELEAHGTWGSLCDAGWDMPDTQVLCHHLGCGFATSVSHGGCFGTRSGPLWRDTFHCCGTESHLGECPAMALGTPACSLGHVAAVNCSGGAEPLRLVDGESRCDGRLEVALGGAWDQGLAQCNATLHSSVPPGRTQETAVVCSGACAGKGPRAPQGPEQLPQPGLSLAAGRRQVRLVSGPRFCPSRVEVYVQGAWSCIWDAAVVCHQLGCGEALAVPGLAHYGQGSGPVLDIQGLDMALPFFTARILQCPQGFSTYTAICQGPRASPTVGSGGHQGREQLWDIAPWANLAGQAAPGTRGIMRGLHILLCGPTWAPTGTGELRLVDGGSRCAGRVEVKHEGQWGTVCSYDFIWDVRGASVVCRQLGCGTVARTSPYTPFGAGAGRIWLQPFFCRGTETALHHCSHYGWGQHYCGHDWDVGVTCSGEGLGDCAGGQPFGCARLGAIMAMPRASPPGTPRVWEWRWRAALSCPEGTSNADAVELRLVNGGGPCAGRVEVKLRGQWGTVADNEWDMEDAEVVCQQLGCGSAKSAHAWSRFGKGSGPIHLAVVDCRGDESALWECTIKGWELYNGSHSWDVGVVCQGFVQLVGGDSACSGRVEVRQGRGWATLCKAHVDLNAAHVICKELGCGAALAITGAAHFGAGAGPIWDGGFECAGNESLLSACTRRLPHGQGCTHTSDAGIICSRGTEPLRLVDGESRCDGHLEVALGGAWGRVLPQQWDDSGASVVCRQLRCGTVQKAYTAPVLQPGSSPLGLSGLQCAGTETHLAQCNATLPSAVPSGHTEEAVVVCSGSRRVRLASGPGRCAGRVEVYVQGAWIHVCEDAWDLWDAAVVCRQLGCGKALAVPGSARYGRGSGPVWLGAELTVLRLAGSSGCTGRLEVFYNGTWGSVCANGTSPATAAVVCQQLGCGATGRLASAPATTQGSGPAWLAWVQCELGTDSLWHCPSAPWQLQPCDSPGDTHITCAHRSPTAGAGAMAVPTILCIVLGTLLCLALGALAVQAWRAMARHRGPGRTGDTISEAVYEELDYTLTPDYQEVPSGSGSPSEGSAAKLPYYTSDSVEVSSPATAADTPALPRHGPPDGYDDAAAVLHPGEAASPGLSDGDVSEVTVLEAGSRPSLSHLELPGATTDAPASAPRDMGYDDVGVSGPRTSL
ncbi:scavenger receptor cysteine-rich type 1 protein M130-like [Dromaius novaehollandiae]|uniref:scavenger receptor cysteine-rich type 1 protein M130-like n=1 Tax=Dromaius novaehollandiae TaxID=8790 RepID=UPI00311D4AA4